MLMTLIILLIMANTDHTYYMPGTAPSAVFINMVSLMRQELLLSSRTQ